MMTHLTTRTDCETNQDIDASAWEKVRNFKNPKRGFLKLCAEVTDKNQSLFMSGEAIMVGIIKGSYYGMSASILV